jgi:iron complex outermembrane receptor protein
MCRRLGSGAGALAALLSLPAPASAQNSSPVAIREEVIVTATVTPVPFDAVARSVWVVTREDLDLTGASSVIDALRLVPVVDPKARGPRDVQTDVSIRGATFGQSLVLVDGLRLNDSQSGHHNGELPVPVSAVERIEVLAGSGSSVHGADALGGTINIVSRRDAHATASVAAGQHGYVWADASSSGTVVPAGWTLAGWASRSGGFAFDRDFAQGGGLLRGALRSGWIADVRHQRRAFGANGFYGASPSKEWTDQTLASLAWSGSTGAWTTSIRGLFRNHGDHFRWDINRPGFAENRHRTNATDAAVTMVRELSGGRRVTAGASGGGDWVRSSNLGDHEYGHAAAFIEVLWPFGGRTTAQAGLRFDGYSTFGHSWSPTVAVSGWVTPLLRLRGSVAHAFRIPTFTELYYTDPGHLARSDLKPERGWSLDGGADWSPGGWLLSVSLFRRADQDVIDWVKAESTDRWRTTNVRDVTTAGIEVSAVRRWRAVLVRLSYAGQRVEAPSLDLLSKYVLEYARHSGSGSVSAPVGAGARLALSLDHRRRIDGQRYTLGGLRLSRVFGRSDVFLDVSNLFDEVYREIAGVEMPGRWMTAGVTIR